MTDTVIANIQKIFYRSITKFALDDAVNALLIDEDFHQDVKNRRIAVIHLSKKHFGVIVRKVVNDLLNNQSYQYYRVLSIKYRFFGMDVFVFHRS